MNKMNKKATEGEGLSWVLKLVFLALILVIVIAIIYAVVKYGSNAFDYLKGLFKFF